MAKERAQEEKPRRIKGEGSISKRKDGAYMGRLTIGRDEKGRQIQKSVYGKTKSECVAKLNELRKIDFSTNSYSDADKITYRDWVEYWWLLKSGRLAPKTEKNYKMNFDKHILPRLGQVKLGQLNHHHIENCLNELKSPNEKGVVRSQRFFELIYFLLNTTLETAVTKEVLLKNPCRKVERPRNKPEAKGVPSAEDVYKIIDCAYPKYQLFYEALWETGARRSEILALTYRDLDHKEPGIFIDKVAYWDEDEKEVKVRRTTKTDESRRKVLLSKYILDKLAGTPHRITGNIFVDEAEELFNPNNLSSAFAKAVIRAGFKAKDFSLHSLRHAHAHTLLKNKAGMEVVQNRLGHATIDITIATYGHVSSTFQKEIPNLMDRIRKEAK